MIARYECREISEIWTDQYKFETYLKVERAILKAQEGINVPKDVASKFQDVQIKPERIDEIERITKHDVIAFCTSITEQVDQAVGKYFHFGVTSSDIIDTALSLQIKESIARILPEFQKLLDALKDKALDTKNIISMGRSHGMFAEPMSFGLKFLSSYSEFERRFKELKYFYENEITGQFSGAVGNYTIINPDIELKALSDLGLAREPVSTQIIPRDRIAKLVSINALIADALERLAIEIRHLHHSDINEIYEGFAEGQKGSSIMPHKKNPISGENISGIARIIRSHQIAAHENTLLWHERDISHSSAERLMLPDNLGLLLYALKRMTSTVQNLVILEENIEAKVEKNHTYLSSYLLHAIIKSADITREDAYKVVQEICFNSKDRSSFEKALKDKLQPLGIEGNVISELTLSNIKKIYLKDVDSIYRSVLD